MRKKIVRDKINESVNCHAKTNRKRNRIAKNQQKNRSRRKHQRKNIVRLKRAFSRKVMRLMDFPKNTVKQPTMDGVRQNFHSDEAKNC